MICPECKGKGTAVYSCETHPDENSVAVHLFEDICHTCHGSGQKPQTNADRIRAMSDEELVDALMTFLVKSVENSEFSKVKVEFEEGYRDALLEELRQPVKDGDTDG